MKSFIDDGKCVALSADWANCATEPISANIDRDDPRFHDLLRRMNLEP